MVQSGFVVIANIRHSLETSRLSRRRSSKVHSESFDT